MIDKLQAAVTDKERTMHLNQTETKLQRLESLGLMIAELSAEVDTQKLPVAILSAALDLTGADSGSIYLSATADVLCCEAVQIKSLALVSVADDLSGIMPVVPIPKERSKIESPIIKAFLDNCSALIEDIDSPDYDLSVQKTFDSAYDYRTNLLLTIPISGLPEGVLGVLLLMNPQSGFFSEQDQLLATNLASSSGAILRKNQQLDEQKVLFESMIQMIAGAVDEKFYLGADHCRRVPVLTMLLAQAVNRSSEPPFAGQVFNQQELYELEVAAWLHDCGKLVTPISLADKSQKLETVFDRIDLVQTRFEIIRRDEEIARLRNGLTGEDLPILMDGNHRSQQMLEDLHFLSTCNHGKKLMTSADQERIQQIADSYRWIDRQREEASVLTEDEVANLSIKSGTLTEQELVKINNHALATIGMLDLLPFPQELHQVTEIVGGYHEHRDEQSLLQARILAIADMFVSVTSENRPSRKTNSLDEAIEILCAKRDAGELDAALLDLFLKERLHQQYAADFLSYDQTGFPSL